MSILEIEQLARQKQIPFEAAKKIRAILDETKKAYGEDAYEADDVETEIVELVTGDVE